MLQFKSQADLAQLPPDDPAYEIVKQQVAYLISAYDSPDHPYIAEDYGWIVLIEQNDVDRILVEIWPDWRLQDVYWEGAYKQGNFIIAIYLANDDFGISFIIPDEPWVNGRLREVLNEILDY